MDTDPTLRFDHLANHPDVVYRPAHLLAHAVPVWAQVGAGAAAVLLIVGIWSFTRGPGRRGIAVAAALLAAVSATAAFYGTTTRGSYVGSLPDKSHAFGLAYPDRGDDPHTYYLTAEAARSKAKETSRDQKIDEADARAQAVRWQDIPAEDLEVAEDYFGPTPSTSVFPDDIGWSKADYAELNEYIRATYGVTPVEGGENSYMHYNPAIALPEIEDATGTAADVTKSVIVHVPGDPLGVDGGYEHYRCLLHLSAYEHNVLGQPLSATPGELECFSSYAETISPNTKRVLPPRVS